MGDGRSQDADVVLRALEGDRAAFGALVERYQNLVAGLAWRYGVPRDEIEDVVADVFLKVYRNLGRYRPDHPFPTWLYRLAANHLVDRSRRMRRRPSEVPLPEALPDPTPAPGRRLEEEERRERVRKALEALPPHYRAVLVLYYVEELRVDEIARTLSLPAGTVKSRLLRGRDWMRRLLTADAAADGSWEA